MIGCLDQFIDVPLKIGLNIGLIKIDPLFLRVCVQFRIARIIDLSRSVTKKHSLPLHGHENGQCFPPKLYFFEMQPPCNTLQPVAILPKAHKISSAEKPQVVLFCAVKCIQFEPVARCNPLFINDLKRKSWNDYIVSK